MSIDSLKIGSLTISLRNKWPKIKSKGL